MRVLKISGRIATGTGVVTAALGLLVMVAWHAQWQPGIQIRPNWAPMQYNTALGFLFVGACLCLRNRRRALAIGCATTATLLGAATLLQYIANVDLGIDNLLQVATITTRTSHVGRPSPNTAFCFTLAGVGFLLLPLVPIKWRPAFLGTVGSILGAFAITVGSGYVVTVETAYRWGNLTAMAAHTSLGFLLVGVAYVALAFEESPPGSRLYCAPAPLFVGVMTMTISVALSTAAIEDRQVASENRRTAAALSHTISMGVANAKQRAGLLAQQWPGYQTVGFSFWKTWAHSFIAESRGDEFSEVLLDIDGDVRAVLFGEKPNSEATALPPEILAILARDPSQAPLTYERGGEDRLSIVSGLWSSTNFEGVWEATFKLDDWLSSLVPPSVALTHAFSIASAGKTFYASREFITSDNWLTDRETSERVPGTDWTITTQPRAGTLNRHFSKVPLATLGMGFVLASLLSLSAYLAGGLRRRAVELQSALNELDRLVVKPAEILKARNEELERKNEELDEFAYVASHDLKSPLRDVDNLAQWICEDAGAELAPASREHLNTLQQRVKRMEGLLDDLLQYSRVGRDVHDELVRTKELIEAVVCLVHPPEGFVVSVPEKNYEILSPKTPLEHTLLNLISNAIKHHDKTEGQIFVRTEVVGGFVKFSVSDDGPGIEAEYHRRIFRMFQTLRPRDEVEGSGMGLALVKKLVERHGGRISVHSKGRGTEFVFTWPIKEEAAPGGSRGGAG